MKILQGGSTGQILGRGTRKKFPRPDPLRGLQNLKASVEAKGEP